MMAPLVSYVSSSLLSTYHDGIPNVKNLGIRLFRIHSPKVRCKYVATTSDEVEWAG
jgi:hypothetical protein